MADTAYFRLVGFFPQLRHVWAKGYKVLHGVSFDKVNKDHPSVASVEQQQELDAPVIILLTLLSLSVFLVLYNLRMFDDNRLTSWSWVFFEVGAVKFLFLIAVGFVLAYGLSRISVHERRPITFLVACSITAAIPLWSEPELIIDASRYFIQAKYFELYGVGYFFSEWGKDITAWTDLPLIPLLFGLVFKFFGESRLSIQLLNTLFFSGTVVLTYLIGKMLWNRTVGLYGAVLLLGIPYLLTQVPLMLVDVPTMFFLSLAILTSIRAIRQDGKLLLVAASITITLAMLSKYSIWLFISILPVIVISHHFCGGKALAQRTALIILGAALLVGIFVLSKFDVVFDQFRLLISYQLPGLNRWGESVVSTFFFQIHPFITLAALFSIFFAIKKRDANFAIIAWLPLLVIFFGLNRIRYIVPVLPMLALMAAYGIRSISSIRVTRFLAVSAVMTSLVIAVFGYLPFLQKTSVINIKEAGSYIDSIDAEQVEVIVLPQLRSSINPAVTVPLIDYFTKKEIVYRYHRDTTPPLGALEKSPLRFTWRYRNPRYFASSEEVLNINIPVAIIFSDYNQTLPAQVADRIVDYRLVKEMAVSDRVFRYQTIIRVYQPV